MYRGCLLLALLGLAGGWPASAGAAPAGDALSECLIRNTTPADRRVGVRWTFATMALDPDVAPMASVTPVQRDAINREAGALVTDLLTRACREPVQQAFLSAGPQGLAAAFESWGRWAVMGLVTQPRVAAGMGGLLQYIDLGKLMSLVPLSSLPGRGGAAPATAPR